jgi:hypothetical protein
MKNATNILDNLSMPEVLTRVTKNLDAAKIAAPTNSMSRELDKALAAVKKANSLYNKFLENEKKQCETSS